jgi:hypothetical protein
MSIKYFVGQRIAILINDIWFSLCRLIGNFMSFRPQGEIQLELEARSLPVVEMT